MPPNSRSDPTSSESDYDDAPESVSLSQSKKDTQRLEAERRNADAIQRKAKREKNREMDRKLKERAVMNERGKASFGKEGNKKKEKRREKVNEEQESDKSQEPDELEKRMQRAMEEAELESDEEKEFTGISKGEDAAQEEEGADDDDDEGTTARNPDHLPDELFAAAFSSSSKRKNFGDDTTLARPEKKKRRKSSGKPEDIVVGSRAIRILPDSSAPTVPSTTPSKKIDKFLSRALSLQNGKQNLHTKGWERRPVNIGVLKRDGPPVSFVRNK